MELGLPEFTEFTLHCEKKIIEIRGKKREITYENFTHIFYLCEQSNECKHKAACIYKFSDEYYFCNFCKTLICGLPGYKSIPKSRFCKNCGEVIINNIFANARLAGLK